MDLGSIIDLMGLKEESIPIDFSSLELYKKEFPLILILGYYIGISGLLLLFDQSVRLVDKKVKDQLKPSEYEIIFKNKKLIVDRTHKKVSLLLGGLMFYKKQLTSYNFEDFDGRDVYFNLINSKEPAVRYLREFDLMNQ
jgi:hypothetical protein